jgi:large subunit ribosomal protein L3
MGTWRHPRRGSLQYWPRKRARKENVRIRSWAVGKAPGLMGFSGYKVGMTHVIAMDNRPTSMMKGQETVVPVTIIECPPLKVFSARFYKKDVYGLAVSGEVLSDKLDKELSRTLILPKKINKTFDDFKEFDDITILAYTIPKLTGIGKKRPEVLEIALGGNKDDKLKFAKDFLGKEITAKDVFKEGQMVDIHAVSKGKGLQGPVKRFGLKLRSHKAEKTKRGPGSLGGWTGGGTVQYRVAKAGQMGYHTRTEYNKKVMRVSDKPEEINIRGGFIRYGFAKNSYILVKGSIPGPKKRLVRLCHAIRPTKGTMADNFAIKEMGMDLEKK